MALAFHIDEFEETLKRITVRGSIVGTPKNLSEALAFAAEGKPTHLALTAP